MGVRWVKSCQVYYIMCKVIGNIKRHGGNIYIQPLWNIGGKVLLWRMYSCEDKMLMFSVKWCLWNLWSTSHYHVDGSNWLWSPNCDKLWSCFLSRWVVQPWWHIMPIERSVHVAKFGKYVLSEPLEEEWVTVGWLHMLIYLIVLLSGSYILMGYISTCRFEWGVVMEM